MDHETVELIKVIAWPVAIILVGVFVYLLVRRGSVQSFAMSKDGLTMALAPMEHRDEARYFMDRRISEIDADLKYSAKAITQALRKPILRAVSGSNLCSAALRAIASDLRGPMYNALDENDFKHRLAIDNREKYITAKMDDLKDEYTDLLEEVSYDPCAAGSDATIHYPPWADVEPRLRKAVDVWTDKIIGEVVDACHRKIGVYKEYRPQFESIKDVRFVQIIDECIAKNQGYIKGLGMGDTL